MLLFVYPDAPCVPTPPCPSLPFSDTPSPVVAEAASSIIYAGLQIESKGAGRSSSRSDLRAPTS